MTEPIGKLDINGIDPKEDIRMTGQDLVNLLAEARIDQVMQDSLAFDLCTHVDESEYMKVRDQINSELKSLIKEG
jgi:hypothetical protein